MKFLKTAAAKPFVWIALGSVLGATALGFVIAQSPRAQANAEANRPSLISSITTENMATLRNLDETSPHVGEAVEPAVVHIRTSRDGGRDGEGNRIGRVGGEGSGFLIRPDGWIITNDHVVSNAKTVTVILSDGREFEGTVRRANDPQQDLAVVKIDGKGEQFPTVRMADSSSVRPGQYAIAVGSPFGLENSVTIGHVSALGRNNMIMDPMFGNRGYSNLIQTDAAINPGNSGGPLLNIEGEVIGVNSSIVGSTSMLGQAGNVGIGFAIPSNQARLISEILIEKGKLVRGYMGLAPEDLKPFEKKKFNVSSGAILRDVPSDGPAAAAGLKEGDIITKIGSYDIKNQLDLRNTMFLIAPGTSTAVTFLRNGESKTVNVKITELPADMRPRAAQDRGVEPKVDVFGLPEGKEFDEFRKQFEENFKSMPKVGPRQEGDKEVKPNRPERTGPVRLGVGLNPIDDALRTQFNIPTSASGVVITTIEPGSVAAEAGFEPGDVISEFDGKKIGRPEDLVEALKSVEWGQTKQVTVSRYGKGSVRTESRPISFR